MVLSRCAIKYKKKTKRILVLREAQIDFVDEGDVPQATVKLDQITKITPSPSDNQSTVFQLHIQNQRKPEEHSVVLDTDRPHLLFDLQQALQRIHSAEKKEWTVEVESSEATLSLEGALLTLTVSGDTHPLPLSFLKTVTSSSEDSHVALLSFASGFSFVFASDDRDSIISSLNEAASTLLGLSLAQATSEEELKAPALYPIFVADTTIAAAVGHQSTSHSFSSPPSSLPSTHYAWIITTTHVVQIKSSPDLTPSVIANPLSFAADITPSEVVMSIPFSTIVSATCNFFYHQQPRILRPIPSTFL
ncbi:hypothetical protein GEMRC1_004879 [Eukaryota sp. GEM-RC1]